MSDHQIRLRPAAIVIVLCGLALAGNTALNDNDAQMRFLVNAAIAGVTLALLFLWAITISGLSGTTRVAILAATLLVGCLAFATLRISDVRGDLVPIITWRWAEDPTLSLPEASRDDPSVDRRALPAHADYPQFLGPTRDGRVEGVTLETDWEAHPPRELWRVDVGAAYSGFAVAGRLAVTQEQRGELETVVCYDVVDGNVLWVHQDRERYESTLGGVGPRATPTIAGPRVITYGAKGLLNCLELETGAVIWSLDVVAEVAGEVKHWGMSTSPLVFDGRVAVGSGGRKGNALAAYDLETGAPIWKAGDDRQSYSSPTLMTFAGDATHVVVLDHQALIGHDPATGAVLWRVDWPGDQPKVPQPLAISDDHVVASSGYGVGAASFRVTRAGDKWSVTETWRSNRMKSKFANMTLRDGHIYGLDDGILASVDASTGERDWKRGRYGHGQLLLVGDVLLVTTEGGELVLVEARPDRHEELARRAVFEDKTWNPPALAGRYLLMRNHREAVCLEMAVRD